ncbi:hypothetical protein DICPUDRAFT_38500 [Dictyostelium purpureum]|uniref:Uncharacterized protein n=1 Tax=Dictyostelium purpureum TaxID=5786 RepID=F0ZUL8_DICPU|nr:uncharacterized protein DICPUDRAFT_38500 [Dictyostelium purpureum]EGC32382.1 hypothetical protein DICPUDRAFT_38500 [Dictyostelium purpureum]|eukprot:XP_003291112.1 hypothetical protein DICPUDRAFT_38500 [Dictyostelium purpureum]
MLITRKDLVPILSAIIIGGVSGYYIFAPGLKQIGDEQRRELAFKQQQQQPNSDKTK